LKNLFLERHCFISANKLYRWSLSYKISKSIKEIIFIGLNPSLSDEIFLDNTTKKIIKISKKNWLKVNEEFSISKIDNQEILPSLVWPILKNEKKITFPAKVREFRNLINNYCSKSKLLTIYKTKESWIETTAYPDGNWTSDISVCNECYRQQLVRSHVVDMEFLLFDEDGVDLYDVSGTGTYPQPNNDSRYDLNKIRQVDIALSFRSGRDFYKSKPKGDLKRFIKTLRKDRNTTNKGYVDKYLRESVVVSVYTRNIGAQ